MFAVVVVAESVAVPCGMLKLSVSVALPVLSMITGAFSGVRLMTLTPEVVSISCATPEIVFGVVLVPPPAKTMSVGLALEVVSSDRADHPREDVPTLDDGEPGVGRLPAVVV